MKKVDIKTRITFMFDGTWRNDRYFKREYFPLKHTVEFVTDEIIVYFTKYAIKGCLMPGKYRMDYESNMLYKVDWE